MSFVICSVVLFDLVLVESSIIFVRFVGSVVVSCLVRLMMGWLSILLKRWLSWFTVVDIAVTIVGCECLSTVLICFEVKLSRVRFFLFYM